MDLKPTRMSNSGMVDRSGSVGVASGSNWVVNQCLISRSKAAQGLDFSFGSPDVRWVGGRMRVGLLDGNCIVLTVPGDLGEGSASESEGVMVNWGEREREACAE